MFQQFFRVASDDEVVRTPNEVDLGSPTFGVLPPLPGEVFGQQFFQSVQGDVR